jgi:hypothetical protein
MKYPWGFVVRSVGKEISFSRQNFSLLALLCVVVLIFTGCATPDVTLAYNPPMGAVRPPGTGPGPVAISGADLTTTPQDNAIPNNLGVPLIATASYPNGSVTKLEIEGTFSGVYCGHDTGGPTPPPPPFKTTSTIANSVTSNLTLSVTNDPPPCPNDPTQIGWQWALTVTATAWVSENGGQPVPHITKPMRLVAGTPTQTE